MATAPASSLESPLSSDSDDFAQSLICNVDYHIAKFAPPLTFMVYSRARAISYKTGKFYVGAETLANLFGKEERVIRRCYQDLVKLGFFVEPERKYFSTTRYRVLDHNDWVKTHPGQCIPKFEYVWAGEGDKLAQYLHAATGGWVRLYENQMTAIRKIIADNGLTDDQLLQIFKVYFEDKGKKHRNPKNVIPTFINWLRQHGK